MDRNGSLRRTDAARIGRSQEDGLMVSSSVAGSDCARKLRKPLAEPKQRDLIFDWTDRDVILREAKLPKLVTKHGATIKRSTALLVLYKINSHAGNKMAWPSV